MGAWGRGEGAVEGGDWCGGAPTEQILFFMRSLPTTYHLLLTLTKHIICLMRSFASLETLSSLGKVYRQSTIAWCVCMLLSRLQAYRLAGWGTSGCRLGDVGLQAGGRRAAGWGAGLQAEGVWVVHTGKG